MLWMQLFQNNVSSLKNSDNVTQTISFTKWQRLKSSYEVLVTVKESLSSSMIHVREDNVSDLGLKIIKI